MLMQMEWREEKGPTAAALVIMITLAIVEGFYLKRVRARLKPVNGRVHVELIGDNIV